MSRRLGAGRLAAEPDAAAEIGRLCGYLPLALAIVAARAAVQEELPLSSFVRNLHTEQDRLDALGSDETTIDVRAVFSWSYGVLSPAAARLFRLLGAHIGTDIGVGAAASLAGCPAEQVRAPLAELGAGQPDRGGVEQQIRQSDRWDTLGYVHHHLGEYEEALVAYREALKLYVEKADRYHESLVLNHTGDTHRAMGDVAAARASWLLALEILDDLGHAEATDVRGKLADRSR